MKLTDLFTPAEISADIKAEEKLGVLRELVGLLTTRNKDLDTDKILKILLEREKLGSTGTGSGVAIPHGKVDDIDNLLVSFGVSRKGINFDSIDSEPVNLLFLLVAPSNSIGSHLSALARISNLLADKQVRSALQKAPDAEAIFNLIKQYDIE